MRLLDLRPHWIHQNIFAFDCPHCRAAILTVKDAPMQMTEQMDAIVKFYGAGNSLKIIPCNQAQAWQLVNKDNFSAITVTPSLDASASGHWHGFITNGLITP